MDAHGVLAVILTLWMLVAAGVTLYGATKGRVNLMLVALGIMLPQGIENLLRGIDWLAYFEFAVMTFLTLVVFLRPAAVRR